MTCLVAAVKGAGAMKKKVWIWSVLVLLLVILPEGAAEAKGSKYELSITKRTMTEGKNYTLRLKKAKNVRWKSSDESVVKVKKKSGEKVVILAKKKGKATITASCHGKKYRCKVMVKAKKKEGQENDKKETSDSDGSSDTDAPVLNATTVSLYYRFGGYADLLPVDPSHKDSFRLKVSGTKKEVRKWELSGEDTFFFTITDYGLVTLKHGTDYTEPCAEVTAKATLTDGRTLTAAVRGYNEVNLYLDSLFQKFADENIRSGMTEKEKADRVAEYIGEISDYEYYDSDWTEIFLRGKGDCMASRFAMEVLCRYIGVKAQGCGSLNEHGKTVVKADGKYYIYTTGFDEPRPRSYMVSETAYSYLAEHAKEMGIWMGYFDR